MEVVGLMLQRGVAVLAFVFYRGQLGRLRQNSLIRRPGSVNMGRGWERRRAEEESVVLFGVGVEAVLEG